MTNDWKDSDQTLHSAGIRAISRFSHEHPNESVCCFFFDCDEARYGKLFISIDTLENNKHSAMQLQQFAIQSRENMLRPPLALDSVQYFLTSPVLSPFNLNGAAFKYSEFAHVHFPAWTELAESGAPPVGTDEVDDYLNANARLVMWRVAEQLISEGAFHNLTLASPFIVGYSMHDQEEAIIRILNWT